MLLSLLLHTYSLRYVLPTAVMLGTAPTYILAWGGGAWRLLSTLLPARFYHQVDDRLYTIYQSMVLFFFEHYTGVQVILYGDLPKSKENVVFISNHHVKVIILIVTSFISYMPQNGRSHVYYKIHGSVDLMYNFIWIILFLLFSYICSYKGI